MSLNWLLLILAVALFAVGALRFDVLAARWRQLFGAPRAVRQTAGGQPAPPAPPAAGKLTHPTPAAKPAIRRSGKRS